MAEAAAAAATAGGGGGGHEAASASEEGRTSGGGGSVVSSSSGAAQSWAEAIRTLMHPVGQNDGAQTSVPPKNFLVFVNPVGGSGQAVKIFESVVEPMLKQAGIAFHLVVTERAGHAKDVLASDANLATYTAAVAVGGDGLIYEVGVFECGWVGV
jgi:hypothetical protein